MTRPVQNPITQTLVALAAVFALSHAAQAAPAASGPAVAPTAQALAQSASDRLPPRDLTLHRSIRCIFC